MPTLSRSHARTHTPTHTHTHFQIHTRTFTHTNTHIHTHTLSHTHFHHLPNLSRRPTTCVTTRYVSFHTHTNMTSQEFMNLMYTHATLPPPTHTHRTGSSSSSPGGPLRGVLRPGHVRPHLGACLGPLASSYGCDTNTCKALLFRSVGS